MIKKIISTIDNHPINGHPLVKTTKPVFKQFVKFCLVGVTNLALYLLFYFALTRYLSWHYLPASIVGFMFAVSWSFFVNRHWTFRHKEGDQRAQYVKFFLSNIFVMLINLALLSLLIEKLKIYDIFAQLISSVVGAFVNFSLNRFWTFRKPSVRAAGCEM